MFHIFVVEENPFDGVGFALGAFLVLFGVLAVPVTIHQFYFTPIYPIGMKMGFVGFALAVSAVFSCLVRRPFDTKDAIVAATINSTAASTLILCGILVLHCFFGSSPDFFGGLMILLVGPIIFGAIFLPPSLVACAVVLGVRGQKG